jgi:hypothetical protein
VLVKNRGAQFYDLGAAGNGCGGGALDRDQNLTINSGLADYAKLVSTNSFTAEPKGSYPIGSIQTAELLSEAFQLAWTGGCATGSRTRSTHAYDLLSAS